MKLHIDENENETNGILRPDTKDVHVAETLIDEDENGNGTFIPGRFMLTIIVLGVIFISIIAYFVSQMP